MKIILCGGWCFAPLQVTMGVTSGVLDIRPERVLAEDKDSIKSPLLYSFVSGTPASYLEFFNIDSQNGLVRQIRSIDVDNEENIKFNIIIKVQQHAQYILLLYYAIVV